MLIFAETRIAYLRTRISSLQDYRADLSAEFGGLCRDLTCIEGTGVICIIGRALKGISSDPVGKEAQKERTEVKREDDECNKIFENKCEVYEKIQKTNGEIQRKKGKLTPLLKRL